MVHRRPLPILPRPRTYLVFRRGFRGDWALASISGAPSCFATANLSRARRMELCGVFSVQVDRDEPMQSAVVKQEVEIVILIVHRDPLLSGDKCEVASKLQDESLQLAQDRLFHVLFVICASQAQEVEEIRDAKDQVRCHPIFVSQRGDVVRDQLVGLLTDGRALVRSQSVENTPAGWSDSVARAPSLSITKISVQERDRWQTACPELPLIS